MAALGHCVEFNVGGGVIQDQRSAKCNDTFPKCESIYNSVDAFKCKAIKKQHYYVFMFKYFVEGQILLIKLHFVYWKAMIHVILKLKKKF